MVKRNKRVDMFYGANPQYNIPRKVMLAVDKEVRNGQWINAIKVLRAKMRLEKMGLGEIGLREAKEVVDALRAIPEDVG